MRLFWAITLPEQVRERLDRLRQRWSPLLPAAKWVERENFHLTVKFLGEVEASLVSTLREAVARRVTGLAPFTLEVGGWGTFGRPPRVLWVGVRGDLEALAGLWRAVEEAMAGFGFAVESRYAAHVTLARLRSPQGLEAVRQRADADVREAGLPCRVYVDELCLMVSRLTPQGPHYTRFLQLDLGR